MDSPLHFCNVTKHMNPWCFGPDQFENAANSEAHYVGTGPEIWRYKPPDNSMGTGGTVGGVSRFLKEQNQSFQVWHFDPIEGGASSDYVNTKQSTIGPDGFEFILKRDGATVSRVVVRVLPALKLAMDA
ncbi:hypothetical protein H310_12342 [Aphanomyces invadans]|uniref:Uncharacterized protein n=1 Tax=Aphanomyces invadans TaxID=157072 RepID=A0A024TI97_9STRA|nr:hypothetical protein H310_12342 [Aphanomyces invadans]ETV93778.1 hypothetical protein H310_12342 [Aphanomyces invadans]|eukprot:XP_008877587.1 hypothetical protein H310_12342 [Aphanomyces invadans]